MNSISINQFFDLLRGELRITPAMQGYYKFLNEDDSFGFRKNYFTQRLEYIYKQVQSMGKEKELRIWDCGCGYGTTCLFLALNGYKVYGSTLEFYYEHIEKRKAYWSKFGDVEGFTYNYKNLFDEDQEMEIYDVIILQDTLHHLEPIDRALQTFNKALALKGKLIAIEENGDNVIQSLKLYKQRGNKRIISIWDEKLQKEILIGNENIRGIKHWQRLFENAGLGINSSEINHIRYYLPFYYKGRNAGEILKKEQQLQQSSKFRKKYFFFGLNFYAQKK